MGILARDGKWNASAPSTDVPLARLIDQRDTWTAMPGMTRPEEETAGMPVTCPQAARKLSFRHAISYLVFPILI